MRALFENAGAVAAENYRLPDVPEKAWGTLDDYAWRYDGSDANTRELNQARAKLAELQEIIDLVNRALSLLPADYREQIFLELFAPDSTGGAADNPMLRGLSSSFELGSALASIAAGDSKGLIYTVLGRVEGGDYKPSAISLESLQKLHERIGTRLYRLMEGLGGGYAGSMPVPSSMSTTVETFMSNQFSEGVSFQERDDEGKVIKKTEHITSNMVEAQLADLELWVSGLDEDKRQRMEALLARVPSLVEMVNEALGLAEGGDKRAYIAMFLGSSSEPKFSGDNPELNAANVGKLIAAVVAGDTDALAKFADMNAEKIDEIVLDFIKVEGEFRQTRDITTPDDQAARDHWENVVQPGLAGESEFEKSELEKRVEALRRQAQAA